MNFNNLEIFTSKKGLPVFKINNISFHSKYDPLKEGILFFEKVKDKIISDSLIVFLGGGFFYHILPFLEHFKNNEFILIEKDKFIYNAAVENLPKSIKEKINKINIVYIEKDLEYLKKELKKINNLFSPIIYPPYLKLHKEYYEAIYRFLIAKNSTINFWENLKYPKFKNKKPKILLITSKYFLIGEIINALKKLNIEFDSIILLNDKCLTEHFVKILLEKISTFKPDFTFTINHLGIDQEGVLMSIFEKIDMPILSWYVDNPNLIIKYFKKNISDLCTLLVWDKDNIQDMKNIGFKNVFYLPLGTDTDRFRYINFNENPFKKFYSNISFVGKSMILEVKKALKKTKAPKDFLKTYKRIAVKFVNSNERSVAKFIEDNFPNLFQTFLKLNEETRTYFETLITWESTRIYRYKCVKEIVKFNPLIVGDINWKFYFRNKVKYHPEVNYYYELPFIYNISKINFNTTSLQMKNAVNQRIFDVPACRRFIITDYRRQIEDLFELEKEVVCYKNPNEIGYLVEKFLKDEKEKDKIIKNAYKRVINEHKYTHRVLKIIEIAKKIYG